MRFMVFVKGSVDSEAGKLPPREAFEEMGAFNEEMAKAGIILALDGLHPSSKGARIRFEGTNRTVIDGPFTEAKELVAGFWIINVRSKDEAIEWMKRSPFREGEVEIREIYEFDDLGEAVTPERRARAERLRAELEAKQ